MRLKKVKFGNDPQIHFVVGLDLNRIEIQLMAKNNRTMANELRLKKEYYIVNDDIKLHDVDTSFIKRSEVVIADLILDLYDEYLGLKEIEDEIFDTQLDKMGYIEIQEDKGEEEDYS